MDETTGTPTPKIPTQTRRFLSLQIENFKQFQSLQWKNIKQNHLINGPNNAGKTSLFYALVLFCRAYNTTFRNSKPKHRRPSAEDASKVIPEVVLDGGTTLAALLNNPLFATYGTFKHFRSVGTEAPTIISAVVGNKTASEQTTCTLRANGGLTITPDPPLIDRNHVIRFAYMGADSVWCGEHDERQISPLLSSNHPNHRTRYYSLTAAYKDQLNDHLKNLFDGDYLVPSAAPQLFANHYGREVDIALCGSAFRKVYVSLVTLFLLAGMSPDEPKIMLLEEPEAYLYPSLVQHFMRIMIKEAKLAGIQLLVISNVPDVQELYNHKHTYALYRDKKKNLAVGGNVRDHRTWLPQCIELHLFGLRNCPLILCEGADDVTFLKAVAPQYGIDVTAFQIQHVSGGVAQIPGIIRAVAHDSDRKVYVVLDRDFAVDPAKTVRVKEVMTTAPSKSFSPSHVHFWELPTIESFLFVTWLMDTHQGIKFDEFNQSDTNESLATQFSNGFKQQNTYEIDVGQEKKRVVLYNGKMFETWAMAYQAAQQKVDLEVAMTIAQVIHGHTWADLHKKSTADLIDIYGKKIPKYFPKIRFFEFLKANTPHASTITAIKAQEKEEREKEEKDKERELK